jgi:hypothetical protein
VRRPGVSGDFIRWEDEVHGTYDDVSEGVARARDPVGA